LEKHFENFKDCSLDQLILHGLRAIRDTLQQDKKVTTESCSIGIVGIDSVFTIFEGDDVQKYIDALNGGSDAMDVA
jgi:20S proteasome subunit alpha 6